MKSFFYNGPSLDELHEFYARRGRIDDKAQIVSRYRDRVEASPAEVWAVLGHPEMWPDLDFGFNKVHLPKHEVGGEFLFEVAAFPVRARLGVYESDREISWSGTPDGLPEIRVPGKRRPFRPPGKLPWIRFVDRNFLTPLPDGTTDFHIEESLSGAGVTLGHSAADVRENQRRRVDAIGEAVLRARGQGPRR